MSVDEGCTVCAETDLVPCECRCAVCGHEAPEDLRLVDGPWGPPPHTHEVRLGDAGAGAIRRMLSHPSVPRRLSDAECDDLVRALEEWTAQADAQNARVLVRLRAPLSAEHDPAASAEAEWVRSQEML